MYQMVKRAICIGRFVHNILNLKVMQGKKTVQELKPQYMWFCVVNVCAEVVYWQT